MSIQDLPAWSPDGRYLAMLDFPKDGDGSLAILDAADQTVRKEPMPWPESYCADFCVLGWHDADTVSLPIGISMGEASSPSYSGMRLISTATGETEEIVELPGAYASADDWSTDGRHVTLVTGGAPAGQPRYVVYDTVERREVMQTVNPLDVWWVSPTQWLQFADGGLVLADVSGSVSLPYPVPPVAGAEQVVFIGS
jgi:hypothetical protein